MLTKIIFDDQVRDIKNGHHLSAHVNISLPQFFGTRRKFRLTSFNFMVWNKNPPAEKHTHRDRELCELQVKRCSLSTKKTQIKRLNRNVIKLITFTFIFRNFLSNIYLCSSFFFVVVRQSSNAQFLLNSRFGHRQNSDPNAALVGSFTQTRRSWRVEQKKKH